MLYALTVVLTLILSWCIIIIKVRKDKKEYSKKLYSQKDMHEMLKIFFSLEIEDKKKKSQAGERNKKKQLNAVILQDKAYWVRDNVFYVGDSINGTIVLESGSPIDTKDMSKSEISKLLFILDKLQKG